MICGLYRLRGTLTDNKNTSDGQDSRNSDNFRAMRSLLRSLLLCHLLCTFFGIAAAFSPSGGYAPGRTSCPSNSSFIREGTSISENEREWIESRHDKTNAAILHYLENAGLEDFDLSLISDSNLSINIALAFSGGGYRAMLSGAGQLAALDNRSSNALLGGVLQSSSYIAGLSGGSWLLSLLYFQNFPSIDEVVLEDPYSVWDLTASNSLVNTSNYVTLLWSIITTNYYKAITHARYWIYGDNEGISNDVAEKQAAGFPTSLTDVWGRGLAHQLFPEGTNNWLSGATWSDIRQISSFANHEMPFPLVTALARRPSSLVYDLNSPIVEFNPYEMGSFDTSINTFHDVKYLGTKVSNGVANGTCIQGFDNAAFVLGTSSSLFNQYLNTLACDDCDTYTGLTKFFLKRFLTYMSKNYIDIALYKPNPFFGSKFSSSDNITNSETLYLMDGGLAGEIIPLSTLMVKERALDLVFAFDNNGAKWPNGEAVISTYERQFTYEGKSTVCPYIPGESTFGYFNLTAKPTFFGCDAKNLTDLSKDGVVPPIVVYIANRPFEFYSNTSTTKLTYTDQEKKGMITNGFDVASQLNGTFGEDLRACIGCAMIRREQERQGIEQSDQCKQCFENYCWDGQTYENPNYYQPINFTGDGLTNGTMKLWGNNTYISSSATATSSSLGTTSIFVKIFNWIKSLF